MNEHSFIQSIHRKINKELYVWKINAAFQNGVPDAYYSGACRDLWVEYKYGTSHETSALQQRWLTERYKEGRDCWLVWGITPDQLVVFKDGHYPKRLEKGLTPITKAQLVSDILSHCNDSVFKQEHSHGREHKHTSSEKESSADG
jgi:hypothetical protein